MPSRLQVGVIGLGKFGLAFATSLMELRQEVMGVDDNPENVRRAQDLLTQVYQADAMEKKALEQLGFAEMTHVVVSVGSSIEASCMISLHLKELGTRQVWVKAVSRDHEKLLHRIGVDEVIFPEYVAANRLANKLVVPGLIEFLPYAEDIALVELTVDNWQGKTLRDLDLTNTHGVQVISIRRIGEEKHRFTPKADEPLRENDSLVVIGQKEFVSELKP